MKHYIIRLWQDKDSRKKAQKKVKSAIKIRKTVNG